MAPSPEVTITELLLARAEDHSDGLLFEDRRWTHAEHTAECAVYAATLDSLLHKDNPPHVGILADNIPEFSFLLGGAALAGAVLVGLNPTRRGQALASDIHRSDCAMVLTESKYLPLLDGLDLDGTPVSIVDDQPWRETLAAHAGAPLRAVPAAPGDLAMLIFTSGTSGEPKAVRCTHSKVAYPGAMLADRFRLTGSDVAYLSMPMFHSNAIMAGWSVGLAAGAAIALRRRFSASSFLGDVRAFGATYANYVGKPLSYVLATEARPDDADNPLRLVYGNEGNEEDLAEFGRRFGVRVFDAFGSTEGGVNFGRSPDTPAGSLGTLLDGVEVHHPETGKRCATAEFSADGTLLNAADAVGELVNTAGAGFFAGYYNDPDAEAERMRGGVFHTGDLAYVDSAGNCWFAGRLGDWLRVDGENLGTAPIERVLLRHPAIAEAAVYGVPDEKVGDAVMAAVVLDPSAVPPEPAGFGEFLAGQSDLGPKQWPRHIRITAELPRTPTYKVIKRRLTAAGTDCPGERWVRDGTAFRRVSSAR